MVQQIKTTLGLLIILIFVACSGISDSNYVKGINEFKSRLNGLWSLVRADSSYAEVYFKDSIYWFFQSDNILIRNFSIEKGDTILTYSLGDTTKFKLTDFSERSFVTTSGKNSIKYNKVIDSVFSSEDWIKIIQGDEKLIGKYRLYFFAREYQRKLNFK